MWYNTIFLNNFNTRSVTLIYKTRWNFNQSNKLRLYHNINILTYKCNCYNTTHVKCCETGYHTINNYKRDTISSQQCDTGSAGTSVHQPCPCVTWHKYHVISFVNGTKDLLQFTLILIERNSSLVMQDLLIRQQF